MMEPDGLTFFSQYVYFEERKRKYSENAEQRNRKYYNSQNGYNINSRYYDNEGNEAVESLFVGPACGANHRAIKLAVYGDSFCTKAVEGITVKELLGYDPLADDIDIFQ